MYNIYIHIYTHCCQHPSSFSNTHSHPGVDRILPSQNRTWEKRIESTRGFVSLSSKNKRYRYIACFSTNHDGKSAMSHGFLSHDGKSSISNGGFTIS